MPEIQTQPSEAADLDEIDAILNQATANLEDVAEQLDDDSPSSASETVERDTVVPDPQAALEQVEQNLNNLEQMLDDGAPSSPVASESAGKSMFGDDVQPVSESGPPRNVNSTPATRWASQANQLDEELQAAFDSIPTVDVDLGDSLDDFSDREADQATATPATPVSEVARSMVRQCLSLPGELVRGLGQGSMAALIGLLVMVDKPFGWLSEGAKSLIGVVAIATSLTAIAVWAVRDLLIEAHG